jgi:hypothetical protein
MVTPLSGGHAVAQLVEVAGSIPDGVIGIFHWHNPFGRTVALVCKGGVGLTTLPPSCADCLEIWAPQPLGTLMACPGKAIPALTLHLSVLIWKVFDKALFDSEGSMQTKTSLTQVLFIRPLCACASESLIKVFCWWFSCIALCGVLVCQAKFSCIHKFNAVYMLNFQNVLDKKLSLLWHTLVLQWESQSFVRKHLQPLER